MGATGYLGRLRECVGHAPLLAQAAAACIRDEEGRILPTEGAAQWRPQPVGFPRRRRSAALGQRAAEAVVREVREETGLEVEPVALIGVYSGPEYAFVYTPSAIRCSR